MNQYVAQRRPVLESSKSSNAPRPYLLCFSPYPINLRDAEPIAQIVARAAAARPRPAIHRETKRRDHFGRLSVPLCRRFRPDGSYRCVVTVIRNPPPECDLHHPFPEKSQEPLARAQHPRWQVITSGPGIETAMLR